MYLAKRTVHQLLAYFPVLSNQFLVGVGMGWISPTLKQLQNPDSVLPLTEEQVSWVASLNEIGRVSGPIVIPFIVDTIGRRCSMIVVNISFFLIWCSVVFFRNVYLLYVVRALFGVTHSMFDVVASAYMTENCCGNLRAVMAAVIAIVFNAGNFIEIILASYLPYRTTAIINVCISICALFTLYYCVESPHFLIMKERYAEAKENLLWLEGETKDCNQKEFSKKLEKLKNDVQDETSKESSTLGTIFASIANVRSIFIVLSMHLLSSSTGGTAINSHAALIFPSSDQISSYQFTIFSVIATFVSVCVSPFVVPRIDRKKILIVSFSMLALCQLFTSLLLYLHNRNYKIAFYPWLVFISIAAYGSIKAISAPAMYIIKGELLPISVRAIGGSMAIMISALAGFCSSKMFLSISQHLGMEINFLMFTTMCVLMCIFIYCFLPETRGKSLLEIRNELKKTMVNNKLGSVQEA